MRRSEWRPYQMAFCATCQGERPHSRKGECQACKQRAKAEPGRHLYRQTRALIRSKARDTAARGAKRVGRKGEAARVLPLAQKVVQRRAEGRCDHCGKPLIAIHHHHRRPRQAGGTALVETNSPANLLALLPECHDYIESHRAEAYAKGWLVLQSGTPSAVPVLTWRGWIVLDNYGGWMPADEPKGAEWPAGS